MTRTKTRGEAQPAPDILLRLAHLEGASDLPRALFVWEALRARGCVVASARAERADEELGIAEVEGLGELLQTSVDRRGVSEALLRTDGGMPVLVRRRTGTFEVMVAAAGAQASDHAESLAGRIRLEPGPRDTRVAVAFWSGSSGDPLSGIGPRWRRLALPSFAEIRGNYPTAVQESLADLFSRTDGGSLPGRLALWHGPPGTGKTWALRALGTEWSSWCDLHYVTDPERLLGGDTAYMLEVLAGRSERIDLYEDDEETPRGRRRGGDDRWRLLVLEDAGELLGAAAPAEVGRGFARLLNIADGLLGQGTNALILVTTNEPLGKLHPAALRPGRAMATLEFGPLAPSEACAWLAERGLRQPISSPATIAELHALLAGAAVEQSATRAPVGFG